MITVTINPAGQPRRVKLGEAVRITQTQSLNDSHYKAPDKADKRVNACRTYDPYYLNLKALRATRRFFNRVDRMLNITVYDSTADKSICPNCELPKSPGELMTNRSGHRFKVCRECFEESCRINSTGRRINPIRRDYQKKRTLEPCCFCKTIAESNIYDPSLGTCVCEKHRFALDDACRSFKGAASCR